MSKEKSYIYFAQEQGHLKLIKIGHTKQLKHRISLLRTWSAYPIIVLATMDGCRTLEAWLHKKFSSHVHHGEWFLPHVDIFNLIEEINKTGTFLGKPHLEGYEQFRFQNDYTSDFSRVLKKLDTTIENLAQKTGFTPTTLRRGLDVYSRHGELINRGMILSPKVICSIIDYANKNGAKLEIKDFFTPKNGGAS